MQSIPDHMINDLKRRYAEPQRAYHNWIHISDMLTQFEKSQLTVNFPLGFRLAILFHDAVYDPRAADNEARSAQLLEHKMKTMVDVENLMCAQDLIMATHKHSTSKVQLRFVSDAELFLDMDLSILGSEPPRFAEYDAGIRQEYDFVPFETYRARRSEILQAFLDRPRIFLTDDYHARLDAQARINLKSALMALQQS